MTNGELLAGIGIFIGAGTGINGFLFKLIFNRINDLKDNLDQALQNFPKEYKLKKDCIQHEAKVDKINQKQNERLNRHEVAIARLEESRT